MNNQLNRLLQVLAALVVLLLPLERLPAVDLFGITLRLPHLFFLVLFPFWLLSLSKRRRPVSISKLDIYLFLFLGTVTASLFGATFWERGLLTLLFLLFTVAAYFVFSQGVISEERFKKTLYVSSGLVLAVGFWQFFGDIFGLPESQTGLKEIYTQKVFGFPRPQSTLAEPLYLANFLFLPIGFLFAEFIGFGKLSRKKWWLLCLLLLLLMLTVSRGAYLALLITFVFLVAISLYKGIFNRVLILILLSISAWLVAFLLISLLGGNGREGWSSTNFAKQTAVADIGRSESTNARTEAWREAIELGFERPILGTGFGTFGLESKLPKDIQKNGYPIVNNQYLELFSETGILGLIAFLAFSMVLMKQALSIFLKTEDNFILGGIISSLSIYMHFLTFSTLYILYIWILWGVLAGKIRRAADE